MTEPTPDEINGPTEPVTQSPPAKGFDFEELPDLKDPLTPQEKLDLFMKRIEEENSMLDQRLGWLLTLQGLLFASVAFFADGGGNRFPIVIIAIFGVASAVSVGWVLRLSSRTLDPLNDDRENYVRALLIDKDPSQFRATVTGERPTRHDAENDDFHVGTWMFPWKLLPPLLVVLWLVAGVYFAVSSGSPEAANPNEPTAVDEPITDR